MDKPKILREIGSGLTELPNDDDVEWGILREIRLMDNEISQLPDKLNCPNLQALYLQGNLKLRTIPHSFFSGMSALQVLNLSRTRIKSLPETLFSLINLNQLFLAHCDNLLKLSPRVRQLQHLEVLDLQGTAISALPKEIEEMTNLKSLKVLFCEFMGYDSVQAPRVIFDGVISALWQLEELIIDVSTEDERWTTCVEYVVVEVSRLTILNKLKLYIPRVELLSNFKWDDTPMMSPPLLHFNFIVGDLANRIIPRLPHDTELELERHDKCLKYVNGYGIPEEIKKALKHASAFFLDHHQTARNMSEFGITSMIQLKCCVVGECDELETIIDGDEIATDDGKVGLESLEYMCIYYSKNLRSLWEGKARYINSFCSLKYLALNTCPELTTIFTPGLLSNLSCLEELVLDDCPKITRLVSCNSEEEKMMHVLPVLRKISLHFLPELTSVSDVLSISPRLEWCSIYHCPNVTSLPISKDVHKNLTKIKGEQSWWQGLKWGSAKHVCWDDIFDAI